MRRKLSLPGLRWRGGVAYFERKATPVGRIVLSLGTDDQSLAVQRYSAVTTIIERGDWAIIGRWKDGSLHVTELVSAVRDQDFERLRRPAESTIRLRDQVTAFLATAKATTRKRSWQTYTWILEQLVADLAEDLVMSRLTQQDCEAWLHAERVGTAPWSGNTQRMAKRVASSLWIRTIGHQAELSRIHGTTPLLTHNPWPAAKISREANVRKIHLPAERWWDLYEKVRDTPQAAYLACAFLGGLRQLESRMLRPEDVNLGPFPTLHIRERGGLRAWRPKSKNSERVVEIGSELASILRRHVELGFVGPSYFFWSARRDAPITQKTSDHWTRESFELIGLPYGMGPGQFTYHVGRHSFASWLVQNGVQIEVVAELIGDTPEITRKHYAHLIPKTRRAAVMGMEKGLLDVRGDQGTDTQREA